MAKWHMQQRLFAGLCVFVVATKLRDLTSFVGVSQNDAGKQRRSAIQYRTVAETSETAVVDTIWATGEKPPAKDPERQRQATEQKKQMRSLRKKQGEEEGDIFVASGSRAKSVARAIKKRVQLSGRAVVRSIGDLSINIALKGVAIANEQLQGTDLRGEQVLGAVPYWQQVRLREEDDVSNVLFMKVMLLPRPRLEDVTAEEKQILATDSKEKLPKMAAAIKNRLQDSSVAVVLGVGARKLGMSVKAIIAAGRFLREDQGDRGDKLKVPALALLPAMQEFAPRRLKPQKDKQRGEDDPVTIGMRLECIDVRERWKQEQSEPAAADKSEKEEATPVAAPWESG